MFEKDNLCETVVAEIERTIYVDRETIRGVISEINNVVQGVNRLLGGPSIWLYDLNCKYS